MHVYDNPSVYTSELFVVMFSIFVAVLIGAIVSVGAIMLKLAGVLSWSWWQAFMPIALPFGIEVVASIILIIVPTISVLVERKTGW